MADSVDIKSSKKSRNFDNYSYAKLNDCPTSPRKMRLVADMVRGKSVSVALNLLKFCPKEAATRVEKLLLSAITNWQNQFPDLDVESSSLVISDIFVGSGPMLKRLRPAPQGRAHRIRKRSNHVTLYVASLTSNTL